METYSILIRPYTGSTYSPNSPLRDINGYLVYSSSVGGDVVSPFNVKTFLDAPENSDIALKFLEHIRTTKSIVDFRDVFYDNRKLAREFSDYYNANVRQNAPAPVQKKPVSAVTITYKNNVFEGGNRKNAVDAFLSEISDEASFFIPVTISKSSTELNYPDFSRYKKDVWEDGIKYIQHFVNLDFHYNEEEYYSSKLINAGSDFLRIPPQPAPPPAPFTPNYQTTVRYIVPGNSGTKYGVHYVENIDHSDPFSNHMYGGAIYWKEPDVSANRGYKVFVVNKGDDITFDGRTVKKNEVVKEEYVSGGYNGFSIELPPNLTSGANKGCDYVFAFHPSSSASLAEAMSNGTVTDRQIVPFSKYEHKQFRLVSMYREIAVDRRMGGGMGPGGGGMRSKTDNIWINGIIINAPLAQAFSGWQEQDVPNTSTHHFYIEPMPYGEHKN
jgi:hypothetical protein